MVEDRAPGHTKHEFQYRDLNGLDNLQWPVQPPVLDLIEGLWMYMGAELEETWGRVGEMEVLDRGSPMKKSHRLDTGSFLALCYCASLITLLSLATLTWQTLSINRRTVPILC